MTERIGPKFPKSTAEPGLASHASVCQPTAKHEGGSSKAASQRYTTLQFHRSAVALGKGAFGWISAHERTLSALSMIGGFVFDNYAFRRIDLPNTQLVFVDTPGIHRPLHRMNVRMVDAAVDTMHDVDVVGLVVDVTEPPGYFSAP